VLRALCRCRCYVRCGLFDAVAPANDRVASAIALSGASPANVSGTTAFATFDPSPDDLGTNAIVARGDGSVWYTITVPATEAVPVLRLRVASSDGGNDVVVFAAESGAVVARAERCEGDFGSALDARSRCAIAPLVRGSRYLVRVITNRVAFTLTWALAGELCVRTV
jgi:hypothetical protein